MFLEKYNRFSQLFPSALCNTPSDHWRRSCSSVVAVGGGERRSSPAFKGRRPRAPRSPGVRVGGRRRRRGRWAEKWEKRSRKRRRAPAGSLPPPPRKAWKSCAPSVRYACLPACLPASRRMGIFFIHPRPPPPSSLPQTSQ